MYNFYNGFANVANFTVPNPSSICFWQTLRGFNAVYNNFIGTATNWRIRFITSSTKIEANINQTNPTSSTSTISGTGVRVHICFTSQRSSSGRIYFNGVEESNNSGSGSPTSPNTLAVGGCNGESEIANADMEDIRIYNRILTLPEIKSIVFSNGRDLVTSGLLNRWAITSKGNGADIGTDPIYDVTSRQHLAKHSNNIYYRGGFLNPRRRV